MDFEMISTDQLAQMDYKALMEFEKTEETNVTYFLGNAFQYGLNDTPVNYSEALKYYLKCMSQGDARAYLQLGVMYKNGRGVKKDIAAAIQNWEIARDNGIFEASEHLGYIYLLGEELEKDIMLAIKYLREAAENNMLVSCYLLAKTYLVGKDVLQNTKKGIYYLKKCEQLGPFQPADYLLGQIYMNGIFDEDQWMIEKDIEKAVKYLERAEAYDELIDIFSKNKVVSRDINKAIGYCKKSIEIGNYNAAYELAAFHLCADFQYMPWRNVEEGIYWAKFALEHSTIPDMNIWIIKILTNYYDSLLSEDGTDEMAEYVINGYEYLFSQRQSLKDVSKDKQEEAEQQLYNIVSMLLGYYCNVELDLFIALQKELEEYEHKMPRFSDFVKTLRGYGYNCLGEKYLKENDLRTARQCFQISLELGYEEAAKNIKRFKKTLFGILFE